jgi:glutathione S-transferase
MREHFEAVARRDPEARAALVGPGLPDCALYLWRWAIELFARSGVGLSNVAPLSHQEVYAWMVTTGARPTPREVGALMRIDSALRGLKGPKKKKGPPPPDPEWR